MMKKMNKEFIWELNGYSGSIFAKDYNDARKKINFKISIQGVEE